ALHRVAWSYIGCRPVQSSIEGICNVEMPDTIETVCRTVSGCRRAIEGNGGTRWVGCHGRWIKCVLYSVDCADIIDVLPRLAMIVRCRNDCGTVAISHGEINAPVIINPNRRVLKVGIGNCLRSRVL